MKGNRLLGQFARFGIAGGAVALLSVFAYWVGAVPFGLPPLLANLLSYIVNVMCGFHAHRSWSFRVTPGSLGESTRRVRYAIVSILALLMNSLWVWFLVSVLRAPSWTPILPMLFVTPLCTFALGRLWVFGESRRGEAGREGLTLFA